MAQLSAKVQRLLVESQERVLCVDEMQAVIDRLFGSKSWTAVKFAVANPAVKQCEFVSLLKQYGFDARKIKTNLDLFAAAAKRRLTPEERDEIMRTVYGPRSPIYRHWANHCVDEIGKECAFYGHMMHQYTRVEVSLDVFSQVLREAA